MACGIAVTTVAWDDGPEATKLERLFTEAGLLSAGGDGWMCPCCRGSEVHVFFNRHRANRGGGWVWCSRCRRYLHATVEVPDWWQNLASVSDEVLAARPDGLDRCSRLIDEHLRSLLSRKDLDDES
jgi:hypothetical protein